MWYDLATIRRVGQEYDCNMIVRQTFGWEGGSEDSPFPHWLCFSNIQILCVFLAFLIFDPAIESVGVQKSTHTDLISKSWP